MNPFANISEQCRQRLTEQQISISAPGTILKDIQTMIEYIGLKGLATGSSQGNPPSSVLPELNRRMSQPLELNLKRPYLRDYPNLSGLYILLRVMNLVHTDEKRLWLNESARTVWAELNPTEQYFALMEAWLFLASEEVVSEKRNAFQSADQFKNNLLFLTARLSAQWKTFDEYIHMDAFLWSVSIWNAQLQTQFGLIEVQPRPLAGRESKMRGWMMTKARRTPWGTAIHFRPELLRPHRLAAVGSARPGYARRPGMSGARRVSI